ncbi:Dixin [Chamberlinius hualienensis]
MAWVNSQLKKKQGCRLVTDLRNDFRDGTSLANLLEVVGGIKIDGIEYKPSTAQSKRKNVEKALNFMANLNMDIQATSVKDVNDGNIKSTMRLILAIAKHYKPNTVSGNVKSADIPTSKTTSQRVSTYGSLDNRRSVSNSNIDLQTYKNQVLPKPLQAAKDLRNNRFDQSSVTAKMLPGFQRSRTVDPRPMHGSKSFSWKSYKAYRNRNNWSDGDYGDYAGSDSEGSGKYSPQLRVKTSMHNFKQSSHSLNERHIPVNGGGVVNGTSSVVSPTRNYKNETLHLNHNAIINKTNSLSPAKSLPCLKKISDMNGYQDYENYPPIEYNETSNLSIMETCKSTNGNNNTISSFDKTRIV